MPKSKKLAIGFKMALQNVHSYVSSTKFCWSKPSKDLLAQPALLARGNTVYSMPGRLSRLWGMRRDSPVSSLQPDIAHRVLLRVRPPACCASYSEMSSSHLFGVYPGRLFARPRPHPPPVSVQQTGDCTAAASGNAHQQHLTGASLTR